MRYLLAILMCLAACARKPAPSTVSDPPLLSSIHELTEQVSADRKKLEAGIAMAESKSHSVTSILDDPNNVVGIPAYDGSCRPYGAICTGSGNSQAAFIFKDASGKSIGIAAVARRELRYDAATGVVKWDGPVDMKTSEHWKATIPEEYRPAFERFLWGGKE